MPKRISSKNIAVNPNVRAKAIYPIAQTNKPISGLKTVGLKLSRDEAIHLARALMAVTQECEEVDITGYRLTKLRADGTHQVTVTCIIPQQILERRT